MNTHTDRAIAIRVNDAPRNLEAGATVADLVREIMGDEVARAVAVARNGEIVPRATWDTTTLLDGDAVEVVRPVQGG